MFKSGLCLLPALLIAAASFGAPNVSKTNLAGYAYVIKEFPELNHMEFLADDARKLYWKGRYEEAARGFAGLTAENHASTALYFNEKALCLAALGDYPAAIQDLRFAVQYMETFNTEKIEKKALSNTGKEAEKIYFGDPYERALNWALLALFYLDQGDHDNALAACKSGLLADSDATESQFQSDLALLYAIEAKCHLLRGQPDQAAPLLDAARETYRITHQAVRRLYSSRQDKAAILRMSKKERRKLDIKDEDAALNAQVQALDEQLRQASQAVTPGPELDALLSGRFNTLVLVPKGEAPTKLRRGLEANLVFFVTNTAPSLPVELVLDSQLMSAQPAKNVCDVEFQATTRGGRQMDAILNKKASYKRTTVSVGRTITDAGQQAGGLVGLGMALLGGAIQGAGGAISPEADIRCWNTLPAEFEVHALELPEGAHELAAGHRVYFEKRLIATRKFQIAGPRDFALVYLPPASGGFSAQVRQEDPNRKILLPPPDPAVAAMPVVLLPPPLGLGYIERFPSDNHKTRPRAFAPDPQRLAGAVQRSLKSARYHAQRITHSEAVNAPERAATNSPAALQVELGELGFHAKGDEETYQVTLAFRLIDTRTGQAVFTRQATGTHLKPAKVKPAITDAFYACCEQAASECARDAKFSAAFAALATAGH